MQKLKVKKNVDISKTLKYVKMFLNDFKKKTKSIHTLQAYRADLEQFAEFFPERDIQDMGLDEINFYIRYLSGEKGYKAKTVFRKINSMSTFFKYLLKKDIIKKDPTDGVKYPKIKKKLPRILTNVEYNSLRRVTSYSIKLYTMVELMLQTGIRIGELSRLKISDLKLDAHIPMMIIREYNTNPMRMIELNPFITEVLRKYLKFRKNRIHTKSPYLFVTRNGTSILIRNIRSSFELAFAEAGIDDVSPKDLRTTFMVYQLVRGVSLRKIANYLGYKRLDTVELYASIYPKRNDEDLADTDTILVVK